MNEPRLPHMRGSTGRVALDEGLARSACMLRLQPLPPCAICHRVGRAYDDGACCPFRRAARAAVGCRQAPVPV